MRIKMGSEVGDRRRRPRGHEGTPSWPGSQSQTRVVSGDSRRLGTAPRLQYSMSPHATPARHTEHWRKGWTKERSRMSLPWTVVKAVPSLLNGSPVWYPAHLLMISMAWDKLPASLGFHLLILGLIIEPTSPD